MYVFGLVLAGLIAVAAGWRVSHTVVYSAIAIPIVSYASIRVMECVGPLAAPTHAGPPSRLRLIHPPSFLGLPGPSSASGNPSTPSFSPSSGARCVGPFALPAPIFGHPSPPFHSAAPSSANCGEACKRKCAR